MPRTREEEEATGIEGHKYCTFHGSIFKSFDFSVRSKQKVDVIGATMLTQSEASLSGLSSSNRHFLCDDQFPTNAINLFFPFTSAINDGGNRGLGIPRLV